MDSDLLHKRSLWIWNETPVSGRVIVIVVDKDVDMKIMVSSCLVGDW